MGQYYFRKFRLCTKLPKINFTLIGQQVFVAAEKTRLNLLNQKIRTTNAAALLLALMAVLAEGNVLVQMFA